MIKLDSFHVGQIWMDKELGLIKKIRSTTWGIKVSFITYELYDIRSAVLLANQTCSLNEFEHWVKRVKAKQLILKK